MVREDCIKLSVKRRKGLEDNFLQKKFASLVCFQMAGYKCTISFHFQTFFIASTKSG